MIFQVVDNGVFPIQKKQQAVGLLCGQAQLFDVAVPVFHNPVSQAQNEPG